MPITINPPHDQPFLGPTPNRRKFTRAECEFLVDNELLTGRYELIDGEIISKMGQKRRHALAVALVTEWLIRLFGSLRVQGQTPIDVAEDDREVNEPEPDIAVLCSPATSYTATHPGPGEILLIVEVSDTSLRFDLLKKSALYARAAVPEYWVLNIADRRLIVHRSPEAGVYGLVLEFGADESVAPLVMPDAFVRISDLLPTD
jgi:Uma2 family endonuclease